MRHAESRRRGALPATVLKWLRENLFASAADTLLTLAVLLAGAWILPPLIDWALVHAVWHVSDPRECREAQGACWAFIAEKHRFILFGTYPYAEHWRPAVSSGILVALWIASGMQSCWKKWLAAAWIAGLSAISILMWGGLFGLVYVENERWGGLVLTLLLTSFGLAFAFPLSILLALGRRSRMSGVRGLCVAFIELVRGVPLVSVLFVSSVMLPLFLPHGMNIDKLLRAQVALILFASAYLAEAVRGGLQAVSAGQYEAADALGIDYWTKMALVILPQALRVSVPTLVNIVIGFFKDTSLVLIIGLFDLLSTVKISLTEPAWSGFGIEAYLFAAAVYFVFCHAMSRYSRTLEVSRGLGERAII